MSGSFTGQIQLFAGKSPPSGWAFCDGQLLETSKHKELFSILKFVYGRDSKNGKNYFGLPDLRGRAAMHTVRDPSFTLSTHVLGEKGGTSGVTLSEKQLPLHNHPFNVHAGGSNTYSPDKAVLANSRKFSAYHATTEEKSAMGEAVQPAGTDNVKAHENRQPYLGLHFIIFVGYRLMPG
ncbi:Microcystin-dependent protein [Candidatus Electrothrix aarhusensis]|uniref:Microcystin-dependent protein n=1 Tax=Candidatus Electrothrix aarhusensis TaxID=1859131 RepID=A0A444IVJ3_9BACT|nr:Microcystin-dependent protein [Candidatus Electrothrix aarhusensis]